MEQETHESITSAPVLLKNVCCVGVCLCVQRDSEQKMIRNARRTLVEQVRNREAPNMDSAFLNISVRRSNLVSDSLVQVSLSISLNPIKANVIFIPKASQEQH